MHDFTHGGIQSIARQFSSDNLSNDRSPEHISALIKLVLFTTYLILCETTESAETDTDLEFYYKQLQKLMAL